MPVHPPWHEAASWDYSVRSFGQHYRCRGETGRLRHALVASQAASSVEDNVVDQLPGPQWSLPAVQQARPRAGLKFGMVLRLNEAHTLTHMRAHTHSHTHSPKCPSG